MTSSTLTSNAHREIIGICKNSLMAIRRQVREYVSELNQAEALVSIDEVNDVHALMFTALNELCNPATSTGRALSLSQSPFTQSELISLDRMHPTPNADIMLVKPESSDATDDLITWITPTSGRAGITSSSTDIQMIDSTSQASSSKPSDGQRAIASNNNNNNNNNNRNNNNNASTSNINSILNNNTNHHNNNNNANIYQPLMPASQFLITESQQAEQNASNNNNNTQNVNNNNTQPSTSTGRSSNAAPNVVSRKTTYGYQWVIYDPKTKCTLYPCAQCPKVCKTASQRATHNYHCHKERLKCAYCDFTDFKSKLQRHVMIKHRQQHLPISNGGPSLVTTNTSVGQHGGQNVHTSIHNVNTSINSNLNTLNSILSADTSLLGGVVNSNAGNVSNNRGNVS